MEYFAKREETMNCKVQKYRVLVMGLLILWMMFFEIVKLVIF